jgi:hypothetical protein
LAVAVALADVEWWCRRHSAVRFLACGLRFSDSSRFCLDPASLNGCF